MDDKEIRQKAKSLKIRNWHNKKIERLEKEIAIIEGKESGVVEHNSMDINTDEDKKGYLKRSGYDLTAITKYALELGANRMVYKRHINSFACYKEEQLIDNLHILQY